MLTMFSPLLNWQCQQSYRIESERIVRTTLKDRDIIRRVIASRPTTDQVIAWLNKVLETSDMGEPFDVPPLIRTNRSVPDPEISKPESVKKNGEDTSFSRKAVIKLESMDLEKGYRGGVEARSRVCSLGDHRIEVGDEICKLEGFDRRGKFREWWGCVPCFECVVETFEVEVED